MRRCVLCEKIIDPYYYGLSAKPLADGPACAECLCSKVMPRRMRLIVEEIRAAQKGESE